MLSRSFPRFLWAVVATCAFSAAADCLAQERQSGLDQVQSLKWAPQDAAFYSAMLRGEEQIKAILDSRAWQKLAELPIVQQGLQKYREETDKPGTPAAQIEAARQNPQIGAVLRLLGDMLGQEAFVFANGDVVEGIALAQEIAGVFQQPVMADDDDDEDEDGEEDADEAGDEDEADDDEDDDEEDQELTPQQRQAQAALSLLARDPERIKVGHVLVGFRLEDKDLARVQLDALGGILGLLTFSVPELSGRLKQERVDGSQYWVLSLDGGMVPVEQIPLGDFEEIEAEEGQVRKVIDRVKALKLAIALGIKDDFLLVSIGPSTEPLASLGDGESLLSRPEMKPLAKFAGERLTGISYLSADMAARVSNTSQQLDNLARLAQQGLAQSKLSEDEQEEFVETIEQFMDDLKEKIPEPGAMSGFSFLTGKGIEGYSYRWAGAEMVGGKPLTLTEHVGKDPIFAAVMRGKTASEADLRWCSDWYVKFMPHIRQLILTEVKEEDRAKFETVWQGVHELLARADSVTREHLRPALSGNGQRGIVIDAKLRSRRIVKEMPELEEPMPIVEPALVLGLSDAEEFTTAVKEYWAIANDFFDLLREVYPHELPEELRLPEPEESKSAAGTIYEFPLPEKWQVDEQIVPTGLIGKDVAIFAATRAHAERLAAATPLDAGGLLAESGPRAAAAVLDCPALVEAIRPWLQLVARKAAEEQGIPDADGLVDQVNTVLDVLKVFRGVTSEGTLEGDAYVEHSLIEIEDLKE